MRYLQASTSLSSEAIERHNCRLLFRARWTSSIHDEWRRNVLKDRKDLKPEDRQRTRQLMDENTRDGLITGYEGLIDSLQLPDPHDRHVLAVAITGRVDVIVTFNLKDFPTNTLSAYNLEAQHPDEFIAHLCDLVPTAVYTAAKKKFVPGSEILLSPLRSI